MQAVKIALIGPMGAGKSSIGRALAKRLDLNFIDIDQAIEQQCKLSVNEIFNNYGEDFFREVEAAIIAQTLQQSDVLLATGGGSVLSASTCRLLQQHCTVCYLQVSVAQQLLRLTHDQQRPLLPADPVRVDFLQNLAMQRNYLYTQIADIILNTDHASIAELTEQLQQELVCT